MGVMAGTPSAVRHSMPTCLTPKVVLRLDAEQQLLGIQYDLGARQILARQGRRLVVAYVDSKRKRFLALEAELVLPLELDFARTSHEHLGTADRRRRRRLRLAIDASRGQCAAGRGDEGRAAFLDQRYRSAAYVFLERLPDDRDTPADAPRQ